MCFLSAIAVSATIAPRLQLFTNLVCKELDDHQWDPAGADTARHVGFVSTIRPVPCAADPAVQANVTKLLTSACYRVLGCSPSVSHSLHLYYNSHDDRAGYPDLLDSCFLGIGAAPLRTFITLSYWLIVGHWQFSDRYGRVRLLSFNIVPVLFADATLVALALAPEKVPGGYWFLVYTSALEGLIGGMFLQHLSSR